MSSNVFTIKIAGPAGAGIKSSGLLLSHILVRHGFNIRDYVEYPSLVKGGHNTYQVSFSKDTIFTARYQIDLFLSLQPKHWQQHQPEFTDKTIVISEDATTTVPLKELSTPLGSRIYENTICLAIACYLFSLDQQLCKKIVSDNFGQQSPNNQAFQVGLDYSKEHFSTQIISSVAQTSQETGLAIHDGNESFGWGFLQTGGNFYCAYPMSPSSGTLHFLAGKQTEYGIQVIHPEDEIAAASLAVGASFAGARSAVGTSGGGFALMVESISLCGAADLGVVFYLVSRPGPATGLPTWTGQGDLLFAVNAGHGEFNKIVLAPGDQQETFDMSGTALNLAAQFNIPVIVLSDKFIAESSASLPDLSQQKIDQIISTKPLPGTPGKEYMANSYEHDIDGFAIEDAAPVKVSVEKRLAQFEEIKKAIPSPLFYGSKTAQNLIVSFGSTKSTILEALSMMDNKDDFAFLQLRSVWPLNPELEGLLTPFTNIIVIENNAHAQMVSLIKSQFNFNPQKVLLKYDGRPFFPEELAKLLNS
ncbi:2-oxoacid:acceptor oxidoreductase family protein [Candidatus Shapirobacteria bacterium]|nr:2-oxoacid:acceptor oxidoreductase family protein [Candidatus Shapirobacteria bacterium]